MSWALILVLSPPGGEVRAPSIATLGGFETLEAAGIAAKEWQVVGSANFFSAQYVIVRQSDPNLVDSK